MLTGLSLLAVALSAAPLEIILDRTASLMVTQEGQTIAQIGFGMFRTGWQYHGPVSQDGGQGNPTTAKVEWPGGQATVVGKVTELADGLKFEVEATPNSAVLLESAHLNTYLPTAVWGGCTANVDGTPYAIPEVYGGNGWPFSGSAKKVRFAKGDLEIEIDGSQARSSLLQDSRQWGPNLDWRYGTEGGTWNANVKRTYVVTLRTNRDYDFFVQEPLTINAGPDWLALPFPLDPTAGSALDRMSASTPPAGSKGWLQSRNGRFVFEKDPQPQRFYGANLAFSACFMDKPDSDKLARRLAMLGYNAARIHHFDTDLTGGWTTSGSSSTNLDPDKLDRLNYLVAALKKRGIYVSLDLFTLRQIRENEIIPGLVGTDEYKALQLVHQGARDNWKAFMTNLMNAMNPYTKLRWKDDPAIAWICVVNENTMGSATQSISAATRALFDQAWQAAGNSGAWDFRTDEGARFGARLHALSYAWMKSEMRKIGVRALLTDVNGWYDQKVLAPHRSTLDYVDNHNYWDHPSFLGGPWGPPSRGWSDGGMATKELGRGMQNLALSRVQGKPFTVTEFNFVAPNRYRAEGGLFMGALAARQDWDAMFRFAWSHSAASIQNASRFDYFDVQSDPANLAAERAIISLFLHRDLPAATEEGVLRVESGASGIAGGYDAPMKNQIFSRRLASSTSVGGAGDLPAPTAPQPVEIDQNMGILKVSSARTQGVFAPTGTPVTAGGLTATLTGHRGALWVSSLDAKPITGSGRMLLTFVTDVQNSGIRFSGPDRDVLEDWGTVPHLARAGSAEVSITVNDPNRYKVYRLDMAGNRVAEVPASRTGGKLGFTVSIGGTGGATLYHEIAASGIRRSK